MTNRELFRRLVKQHGEDAGDFDNPYWEGSPTKAILDYVTKLEAVADASLKLRDHWHGEGHGRYACAGEADFLEALAALEGAP